MSLYLLQPVDLDTHLVDTFVALLPQKIHLHTKSAFIVAQHTHPNATGADPQRVSFKPGPRDFMFGGRYPPPPPSSCSHILSLAGHPVGGSICLWRVCSLSEIEMGKLSVSECASGQIASKTQLADSVTRLHGLYHYMGCCLQKG